MRYVRSIHILENTSRLIVQLRLTAIEEQGVVVEPPPHRGGEKLGPQTQPPGNAVCKLGSRHPVSIMNLSEVARVKQFGIDPDMMGNLDHRILRAFHEIVKYENQ